MEYMALFKPVWTQLSYEDKYILVTFLENEKTIGLTSISMENITNR